MAEEDNVKPQVLSNTAGFTMMCSESISLIVIAILYGIGLVDDWGIPADHLLLAYIIIKAVSIVLRWLICGITVAAPVAGLIINGVIMIIWICGMITYYIVLLVYFFDNNNDWLDENTIHWIALLLLVIEAFTIFAILLLICWLLSWLIPTTILMAKKK